LTEREYRQEIVDILNFQKDNYIEELREDREKYEKEFSRYILKSKMRPEQKIIDFEFDVIEKALQSHKIRKVDEELKILDELDNEIFEDLAYAFEVNTFTYEGESESCITPVTIDTHFTLPILNAILDMKKLEIRKINWKNYKRDLNNFTKQLEKGLELTENFFPLIQVRSKEDIQRIFLTRMYMIFLDIDHEGVRVLMSILFPDKGKRLPKNQKAHMKMIEQILSEKSK